MQLYYELISLGGQVSANGLNADITYNGTTYGFTKTKDGEQLSYVLVKDDNTNLLRSTLFSKHDNMKYYISENHVVEIGRKVFLHKDNLKESHLQNFIDDMKVRYPKSLSRLLTAIDERELANKGFRLLVKLN